jgi:hypothetical protein
MRLLLGAGLCGLISVPLNARADEPPTVALWPMGAPGFESRKGEKENRAVQVAE